MSALPKADIPRSESAPDKIRVMIVDDAVVVRGLLSRWLSETDDIEVVHTARNGKLAVDALDRFDPHVVVLDIEMPEMDGLTALPLILKKKPGVQVIMASTLTTRNAEISLKALSLGARDYLPKPEGNHKVTTAADFHRELVEKVRALGRRHVAFRRARTAQPAPVRAVASTAAAPVAHAAGHGQISLRRVQPTRPRILAIGSSTGGPQALLTVLPEIAAAAHNVPIVLTQHMPPNFTAILAQHISRATGLTAKEGEDGELLKPGTVYVAPGGRHMTVAGTSAAPTISLNDGPQVNFCKPAVDPLFQSVSKVFGAAVLAIVLTGMGHDGGKGSVGIADAGGNVIAQDEASSVVWGMPAAVAQMGAACAVLPLTAIGQKVSRLIRGETA
ncbi:MAG: chemotaxis response regulator protein-glutamate methylesterase [Rhodobiaceae bacterium]|nr:chemotaxis response regulator protein-glutamate methylesterase [Rhodobiaceae bacterium]